tara:strand:- start:2127 stop:2651 length:525 start_codon:yes stop_codon:yes gene_type:complete
MFNILIKIKNQFKLGSLIQPSFTAKNKLSSFIGSFIAISILGFISKESGYSILIAPFGASTVLVFGLPNSPLAQPRNLILGNLLGSLSSVLYLMLLGDNYFSCGMAVASTIFLGQVFRCLHPPAGAVALLGVLSNANIFFIISPVLFGSFLLLINAIVFNNLFNNKNYYPLHWL